MVVAETPLPTAVFSGPTSSAWRFQTSKCGQEFRRSYWQDGQHRSKRIVPNLQTQLQ